MGYNYFYGQADETQSSRYNRSTQRHTGVDDYQHCCASGPKYPYYWRGKVSKPIALEIKRILRAKRKTILPIVTGALRTISGYTKAGNGRLSLPDIFGSAQLSAILGTAHILRKVSCVSAAGLLLRIHRKRTGEDNTIIMMIIIIIILIRRRRIRGRRRRRIASLFRIELS